MPPRYRQASEGPPKFEQAIISLKGYPGLDQIPNILFRRLNQIIALERKSMDEACDAIAAFVLGASRAEIRAKLEAHPSTYRPLQEAEG